MKNTLKAILAVMSLTLTLTACGPKSETASDSDSTKIEAAPIEAPAATDSTVVDTTTVK